MVKCGKTESWPTEKSVRKIEKCENLGEIVGISQKTWQIIVFQAESNTIFWKVPKYWAYSEKFLISNIDQWLGSTRPFQLKVSPKRIFIYAVFFLEKSKNPRVFSNQNFLHLFFEVFLCPKNFCIQNFSQFDDFFELRTALEVDDWVSKYMY